MEETCGSFELGCRQGRLRAFGFCAYGFLILLSDSIDHRRKQGLKIDYLLSVRIQLHFQEVLVQKLAKEIEILLAWILRDEREIGRQQLQDIAKCVNGFILASLAANGRASGLELLSDRLMWTEKEPSE